MAAIVLEKYTWDATTYEGGSVEVGVKIYALNVSDTAVVNQTTDAQGAIAQQKVEANSHSVATSTTTTTARNPHDIRCLKYGLQAFSISQDITEALVSIFYLDENTHITEATKATVAAYTGISVNHTTDKITMTSNHTLNELYDYLQVEAVDDPQADVLEILSTTDGINFVCEYDLELDNCLLSADGQYIDCGSNDFTVVSSGNCTGRVKDVDGTYCHLTVNCNVNLAGVQIRDAVTHVVYMNEQVASGKATEVFLHTSDLDVEIRVRKSSVIGGGLRYIPVTVNGEITAQGLSIIVNLTEDLNL